MGVNKFWGLNYTREGCDGWRDYSIENGGEVRNPMKMGWCTNLPETRRFRICAIHKNARVSGNSAR
jgi:hypothetical protein